MLIIRGLAIIATAMTVSSCDGIFCTDKTVTYDLIPGSTLYELNFTGKTEAERQGYTCTGTAIRDTAGTEVGQHYVCKKNC